MKSSTRRWLGFVCRGPWLRQWLVVDRLNGSPRTCKIRPYSAIIHPAGPRGLHDIGTVCRLVDDTTNYIRTSPQSDTGRLHPWVGSDRRGQIRSACYANKSLRSFTQFDQGRCQKFVLGAIIFTWLDFGGSITMLAFLVLHKKLLGLILEAYADIPRRCAPEFDYRAA